MFRLAFFIFLSGHTPSFRGNCDLYELCPVMKKGGIMHTGLRI